LLPRLVEAGRLEDHIERLPFAGPLAGVAARRDAFVDVMIRRLQFGTRIDAAAVARRGFFLTPAVINLDFVEPLELDARIGAFGNQELDVRFNRAEFPLADQVLSMAFLAINEHALPRLGDELFWVCWIQF